MTKEELLIHELAAEMGISVRTIRYYISEGLLPAPENKGRYATFDEEYRLRLELILKLKNSFLPLKEIRDRIVGLDRQQVQELLDQLEPPQSSPPYEQKTLELRDRPLNSALNYLSNVMADQQAARPFNVIPPQPLPPPRRQTTEVETWQRIVLAPGLELHVRQAEEPFFRERIRQIVEFARIQFS